ncbi:MAG TPA: putative baseplate assembly protein [Candidatus Angelobacter sp.]|nr:putative baseplate assembly protein [Candidatus Angelobacter sp.]
MIYSCCNENRKSAIRVGAITGKPAVNAPGAGYTQGDVLIIAQAGSSKTATVKVTAVSGGKVTKVALQQNGTGYFTATNVPTTGGTGTGCTLDISGMPNGIDYLEVLDNDAIALNSPRQRTLLIHCLSAVSSTITPNNVLITGGESIINVGVDWVAPASAPPPDPATNALERAYFTSLPDAPNVLLVRTSQAGDFSPYLLRLVDDVSRAKQSSFAVTDVLPGFDPQFAEVTFSFKVECGPNFDCAPPPSICPPDAQSPPSINYLAKDYGSFRGIMLDRLSQLLPGWGATSEADMGIALAELIAYVADRLSYRQDAVATEAYLDTARSRISLRRHALLVDYHIHDGCNARAWMHLTVTGKVFLDRNRTHFYTYAPGMPGDLTTLENQEAALLTGAQIFQPMWDQVLYEDHNQISFYTWGELNCCLPQGATEATLLGSFPKLRPGDVLIFQEMVGPKTGNAADANIRHRCAVRLIKVATQDSSGNPLVDPLFENGTGLPIQNPNQKPTPVTEIQWSQEDALPFPVCISSSFVDANGDTHELQNVSVVFGNIVLADHGLSLNGVDMTTVPAPSIFLPPDPSADHCSKALPVPLPVRFRPPVPDSPVTQAVPFTEVALGELGNPKTTGVVKLPNAGFVSLSNADGFPALTLQPTNPHGWPSSFGVLVAANGANIDLSIVYDSTGGGSNKLVVVEKFTNLSLKAVNSNFVAKKINGVSMLVQVPASYTPPGIPPAGFPLTPTMLSNSAPVTLLDTASKPYLTLQPTDSSAWPPLFGVQAQPSSNPVFFDLTVVYAPPSPLGVVLPVTLESFTDLSLENTASQVNGKSGLITVESFASTAASSLSAFSLMNVDPGLAVPEITLSGTTLATTETWNPKQDLLESGESDLVFVVEVESDGTATLRFGDNTNGRTPETGTHFLANYRIGNGTAGNVGTDTLVFTDASGITCSNPLPGVGGADPETNDQIRRRAPQAFLTQERAVTMDDYARVAEQTPQVDKAVGTLRWTGSWYTVFLTVEPQGAGNLSPALKSAVRTNVERFHLAGQDLELEDPQYVPLQVQLEICVDPDYFQSDVQQALLQVLGSGTSSTGQKGFFFPDNFTFGQAVYLSGIYAAARSVAGVRAVRATSFQPQGVNPTSQYLQAGEIPIGPLQVARLANDPSFPNHGQLSLVMEGGK